MADTEIVDLLETLRNQPEGICVDFLREAVTVGLLELRLLAGIGRPFHQPITPAMEQSGYLTPT